MLKKIKARLKSNLGICVEENSWQHLNLFPDVNLGLCTEIQRSGM